MEPLFFKAENFGVRSGCWLENSRFNGAAFFQSGKREKKEGGKTRGTGFNGAAFFQSGKRCLGMDEELLRLKSFNGAAFFQSGKPVQRD